MLNVTQDFIVGFHDEHASQHDKVGGKGANLARLTAAAFNVPTGFTLATDAYVMFMRESGIGELLATSLNAFDYEHADVLETQTAELRARIDDNSIPELIATEIMAAYAALSENADSPVRVAVRSSGTAEDLSDASFAGMHDSYLDIQGVEQVLVAVKRCWASLWNSRAVAYRKAQGFVNADAQIAVVIQTMVNADVAGVMFTANPLTARVDEFVINGSWGLGETVVSGIVTPDEWVMSRAGKKVKRFVLGSKASQIVRNLESGNGTITELVPLARRQAPSLTDGEAQQLAELGAAVMSYYDGFPQDIEWALADGQFYLLQARAVTGVEFTWDEDIDESFQRDPEQHDDIVWTNQWAREFWSGAITPLHYSVRGLAFEYSNEVYRRVLGFDDIVKLRLFKYRRGTSYFNTEVDARHYEYMLPKALRAGVLGNVHPDQREAVIARPYRKLKAIGAFMRAEFVEKGHGINSWLTEAYSYIDNTRTDALFVDTGRREGLSADELTSMSDADLKQYIEARMQIAADFNAGLWDGFFGTAPFSFSLLAWLIERWYADAEDPAAFQNLLSGLPENWMIRESRDLWDLGSLIRRSQALRETLERHPRSEFFNVVAKLEGGAEFQQACNEFLGKYGHRGHADRDMYYLRRVEDIGLLYDALRSVVTSDETMSPHVLEQARIAEREATTASITDHLRRQSFGSMKAKAFTWTLAQVHKFLTLREDERWCYDYLTMAKKRSFQEVGRRLVGRGVLAGEDDFFFLAKKELFEVLDSGVAGLLVAAKIKARRTVFKRFLAREEVAPMYLRGDQVVPEQTAFGEGGLLGIGTSRGSVTARARVVRNLQDIGTIEKGDILVCNSTDPGWASVFMLIKGLLIESGGLLCHGACLSREYGLPAVTLANAMNLIPDGAMITINGVTGQVTIDDDGPDGNTGADLELEIAS